MYSHLRNSRFTALFRVCHLRQEKHRRVQSFTSRDEKSSVLRRDLSARSRGPLVAHLRIDRARNIAGEIAPGIQISFAPGSEIEEGRYTLGAYVDRIRQLFKAQRTTMRRHKPARLFPLRNCTDRFTFDRRRLLYFDPSIVPAGARPKPVGIVRENGRMVSDSRELSKEDSEHRYLKRSSPFVVHSGSIPVRR